MSWISHIFQREDFLTVVCPQIVMIMMMKMMIMTLPIPYFCLDQMIARKLQMEEKRRLEKERWRRMQEEQTSRDEHLARRLSQQEGHHHQARKHRTKSGHGDTSKDQVTHPGLSLPTLTRRGGGGGGGGTCPNLVSTCAQKCGVRVVFLRSSTDPRRSILKVSKSKCQE